MPGTDLDFLVSKNIDPIFWTPERLTRPSAWWGHVPFAFWITAICKPCLFVELGTFHGASYAAFCEAVARSGLETRCYAVDTWAGDAQNGIYGDDVYSDLREFHDKRYASFSELLRKTFDEACVFFEDGTIDLLHIDGYHTYEAVRHDFETWRPKLSGRAVVLFHDTNVRRDDFGVWRLFGELKGELPTFEFLHCHGLGVAAVGAGAPAAVKELCSLTQGRDIAAVRGRFSHLGARWMAAAGVNIENAELTARLGPLEECIARKDAQVAELTARLGPLEESATQKDAQIAGLTARLGQFEECIAKKDTQVAELTSRLGPLEESVTQKDAQIAGLTSRLGQFEECIAKKDTQVAELTARLGPLGESVAQKDAKIAELTALLRQQEAAAVKDRQIAQAESVIIYIAGRYTAVSRRKPETGFLRFVKARKRSRLFPGVARGDLDTIRTSVFFDAEFYLEDNPDVKAAGVDPALHYLVHGGSEGRNPCAFFSTKQYLLQNPDVAAARTNALLHYELYGRREGRGLPCTSGGCPNETGERSAAGAHQTCEVQMDGHAQAVKGFDATPKEEHAHAGGSAAEIEPFRAELLRSKRRVIDWNRYDAAYQVWKEYRKKRIQRHEALKIIRDKYGVRSFFLLYPFRKTVKPFQKLKRFLSRARRSGEGQAPHVPVGPAPGLRVVYISGEPDTPGNFYRVIRYAQALSAAGAKTEWVRCEDLPQQLNRIAGASLLVIWRARWNAAIQSAIEIARRDGARVVFDIDDLMIDPELARVEIIDGIRSQNFTEQEVREYCKGMMDTMVRADFCTAPTEELAAQIRRFHLPALVLPNGFDHIIQSASRLAVRRRRASTSDELVRIGYAGGTQTHQRDFAVAADAVARVLRERPGCRLVLFKYGHGLPILNSDEFPALREVSNQIEWRTLVPSARLPEELARFDVNLAPLEVGNPFCEAKSELKFFEAALVDVPTVASPSGPFRRAIRNGITGFLAAQTSEWYETLTRLTDDPELRHRVARAAHHEVLWMYGPLRRAQAMNAVLPQLCGEARSAVESFELELYRSRRVQAPIKIPEAEVVFENDQLGEAEVTVVVPLYNSADYVDEALDSVRNQTLEALDLIVVDDKSTDNSLTVALTWAERYKQRFNRIVVLSNKSNSGPGPSRNAGFDVSDTSFVVALDADNRLLPECCATCLRKINGSGAAFVYTHIRRFGDDSGLYEENYRFDPARFIGGNYINAMALISKEAWAAAGGYGDLRPVGWEDFEFWCRLVELGLWGCPAGDAPLAEHHVHSNSMLKKITLVPENYDRVASDLERRHPWLNVIRLERSNSSESAF